MVNSTTLTGKTRLRMEISPFSKPLLVLQVEMCVQGSHWDQFGNRGPDFDNLVWRDAKVEDLPGVQP